MLFIDFEWLHKVKEFQDKSSGLNVLKTRGYAYKLDCRFLVYTTEDIVTQIPSDYLEEYVRKYVNFALKAKLLKDKKWFIKIYDSESGIQKKINILELIELVKQGKFENISYDTKTLQLEIRRNLVLNKPKALYKTKKYIVYICENREDVYVWLDTNIIVYWDLSTLYLKYYEDKYNIKVKENTNDIFGFGLKIYSDSFKVTSIDDKNKKYVSFRYSPIKVGCERISTEVSKEQFLRYVKIGKFDIFGKKNLETHAY